MGNDNDNDDDDDDLHDGNDEEDLYDVMIMWWLRCWWRGG
jgi:hypothetical protein